MVGYSLGKKKIDYKKFNNPPTLIFSKWSWDNHVNFPITQNSIKKLSLFFTKNHINPKHK
jgi:hypothetical protein